jgi:hypothetical protein
MIMWEWDILLSPPERHYMDNFRTPSQCLASSKILNPTPSPPRECVPPAFGAGGGHTRWVEMGWGVNSLEDARHCSVLYCKYFVVLTLCGAPP